MSDPGASQRRRDALAIWQAGVDAVRPQRLIRANMRVDADTLWIGSEPVRLSDVRRILVVGGGKACAAMAAAIEDVLGDQICRDKQLTGWVNVPADCMPSANDGPGTSGSIVSRQAPRFIHLHAGRPAGVNEPRPEGVAGTEEILRLVASLGPDDLCLCLIGGGGSALLPAPVEVISLEDKLALTRYLSAAGANIRQLNSVRTQLSRIKGGGLAQACRAGRLISLIISDVIGDPLDVIASGPTAPRATTPADALGVLEQFGAIAASVAPRAVEYLRRAGVTTPNKPPNTDCSVTNLIIGNLATAVDAAALEAARLGYTVSNHCAVQLEDHAEVVGRHLAERAMEGATGTDHFCFVSGGEPVVVLVDPKHRGLGGRNQQLALAAASSLQSNERRGWLFLSGGTDGEDGPTDAAGAWADSALMADALRRGLDPVGHLARNDAYHFFEPLGGLIRTGPTETNVGDLRVVMIDRPS